MVCRHCKKKIESHDMKEIWVFQGRKYAQIECSNCEETSNILVFDLKDEELLSRYCELETQLIIKGY